jgi:predicted DsbA family dithiol-disulfide isomerase
MSMFKVVSDLVCPWCYIGKRRLEAALKQLPVGTDASVSWHPFQLNPGMPAQGIDRREYLIKKFGDWKRCEAMDEQLKEVGRTLGIAFRPDLQMKIPNTFDSHRVIWLAGQHGAQDAVVESLFRAYFCEGVDLSSQSNLIDVASSAGLEPVQLKQFLSSDEGVAEAKGEESEIKSLGYSAVPLFIIMDRVAVPGAQLPETLVGAWRQAQNVTPEMSEAAQARDRATVPAKPCKSPKPKRVNVKGAKN